MSWTHRHIHLAAMLIVWPIAVITLLGFLATLGSVRGFDIDNILFAISIRAGFIATSIASAWIAKEKGRSIPIISLAFVIPIYAFVLSNKAQEIAV